MDKKDVMIKELLLLMNGAVFPGKGARANKLGVLANEMIGQDVYKVRNIAGVPNVAPPKGE